MGFGSTYAKRPCLDKQQALLGGELESYKIVKELQICPLNTKAIYLLQKGTQQIVVKFYNNEKEQEHEAEISKQIREKIENHSKLFVLVASNGTTADLKKYPYFNSIICHFKSYNTFPYEPLGDLLDILQSHGKLLTTKQKLLLSFSAVDSLFQLHLINISHGDIKPENMIVFK